MAYSLRKILPGLGKRFKVAADEVGNGAVTAAKLASDAVETAKIKNGAVTAAKLASDAVETAKIKNGAVTNAKLGAGSVTIDKVDGLASIVLAGVAGGAFDEADGTQEVYDGGATAKQVLVAVRCDEAIVATTGTYDVGWDTDPDGLFPHATLAAMSVGDVAIKAATIPANEDIDVTITDGDNITAGVFTIVVLAFATS